MRSLEYPFASLLAQPHHHNRLDESAQQLLVWNSSPLFLSQRNGTSKLKNWGHGNINNFVDAWRETNEQDFQQCVKEKHVNHTSNI